MVYNNNSKKYLNMDKEYNQFLLRNNDECLKAIDGNSFLTEEYKEFVCGLIRSNTRSLFLIIDNIYIELFAYLDLTQIIMFVNVFVDNEFFIIKEITFCSNDYSKNYSLDIHRYGISLYSVIRVDEGVLNNKFSIDIVNEHKEFIDLEKGKYNYSNVDDLNEIIFKINNIFSDIKCIDGIMIAKMIEYFKRNNLCDYIDENIIMEAITNKKFIDKFLF